jgi:hypothetical protein
MYSYDRRVAAGRQYIIFPPTDGRLYHDASEFTHLIGLLKTKRFKHTAHFRTREGWTPSIGGGIVFKAKNLQRKGVYPVWYEKPGADRKEARAEVEADGLYPDPDYAQMMGSQYLSEREWQTLPDARQLRFTDADIEWVWVGNERASGMSKDEMEAEVRELLPARVKIDREKP